MKINKYSVILNLFQDLIKPRRYGNKFRMTIFGFLLSIVTSVPLVSAGNFVYPLDQIAVPSCRFQAWSALGADCKMPLPRIINADYEKYKNNTLLRRIYSVLWGATYDYGWDVGMGSHEGVDIATSVGTPVRTIGDGTVMTAGPLSGWGNAITIRHSLGGGKYIYSNYAHLSKILVKKGDIVRAGSNIGEVGNTGNSYGNHLHFQIDITNQNHPYYFLTCGKGVDPVTLVNQGLCRDFLTTNTIDPILFLEKQEISFSAPEQLPQAIQKLQQTTQKIEQKTIKSREQILDEEIQEFLNWHTISVSRVLTGDNAELRKTYSLRLSVSDKRNVNFNGSLPVGGIKFDYDPTALRIFPNQIIAIENGGRDFNVTGLKLGKYVVNLKLGNRIVTAFSINVFKSGELSRPTGATFIVKKSLVLGEKKLSGIVMKSKYGTNQLDIPYSGTYVLKSPQGNVKFCNVSRTPTSTCDNSQLVEELSFTYSDTYRGVLVFDIVALDFMPAKLALYRVGEKIPLAIYGNILIDNPLGLDKSYAYYLESISGIKKAFIDLSQGYLNQDRDITGGQMKTLIRNYFSYLTLSAGTDIAKKDLIQKTKAVFEAKTSSIGNYDLISRIQLSGLLVDIFGLRLPTTPDKKWFDENGANKDIMTTLRTRYRFAWRDQFGENYFQPEKKITIGESLYLLNTIDSRREYFAMNQR